MEETELEKYRKAGKIAKDVREWSRSLVKPGAKILDIVEKIESRIKETAGLAFPTNICINEVTAHYTPNFRDDTILKEDDVVSVDIGVHVDGFIADTAYTIDLSGEHKKMLEANKKALDEAIGLIKPGTPVSLIGEVVQKIITEAGFKPIENLTGHEVKQYDLHAGLSVPNIKVPYDWKIEEGMVLALEPFATNGYGRVIESKQAEIFSLIEKKPTRLRESRLIIRELEKRKKLPFAERWFARRMNPMKLALSLTDLLSKEIIKAYPILHEKEDGIVSQFEHTVIVTEDGCEVTTD